MKKKIISKFVAQLGSVRTDKDGGGKIVLEFGHDALKDVQKLQEWNGVGEVNFAIAITPLDFDDVQAHENMEF